MTMTSEGPTQKKKSNHLRVCLVASAGGHMSQLLRIATSWNGYDTFCITTAEVVTKATSRHGKVYVVAECNRRHPLRLLGVLMRCILITIKERPGVVMSTGAASGCIMCYLGRLSGAKIIWIDSITNVERISLSGRLVRPIADLFLVQWPELVEKYGDIEYVGAVV